MTSEFFLSSRRRHTRWNCDWSSDVCSSDLDRIVLAGFAVRVDDEVVEAAIGSGPFWIRIPHQTDHRSVEGNRDVQWPRVGSQHERGSVQDTDEVAQATAERGDWFVPDALHDNALRRELTLGPTPDEHRLET